MPHYYSSMAKRRYEVWPGQNLFFWDGRLSVGPDTNTLGGSIVLISLPSAVYFIFVCPSIWTIISPIIPIIAIILFVSTILSLLITAFTDPGIVMRDIDALHEAEMNRHKTLYSPPRTKEVEVNGVKMMAKYCDTCRLYRPLRASHCGDCNNCVERFDHHCPWIGGDVGKRNYPFFVIFVTLCFLDTVFYGGTSLANLIVVSVSSNFWQAIAQQPASLVILIFTFFMMFSVGTLTCFHCYLVCENVTTHEDIRGTFRGTQRKNPFAKGCFGNLYVMFCRPVDPPNVNFREFVDDREEHLLMAYGGDHRMTQADRTAFRERLRQERKERADAWQADQEEQIDEPPQPPPADSTSVNIELGSIQTV